MIVFFYIWYTLQSMAAVDKGEFNYATFGSDVAYGLQVDQLVIGFNNWMKPPILHVLD